MTHVQTKITTYPPLPTMDIAALEKLILSKVLDYAESENGVELYTDTGPMNPVAVTRHELKEATDASDPNVPSLVKDFLERQVSAILSDTGLDPETVVFIDLSEFPWQFIVQDIMTRSPTAQEVVVIHWISESSQRPGSFGAGVSLITENGIFHATSEDLLADFRRRDRALESGNSDCPAPEHNPPTVRGSSAHSSTANALVAAERFITGFEDDERQEGIADILAALRGAIRREQLQPDLLDILKELRSATIGFRDDAYRREAHLRIGNEAVNMLSASLLATERMIARAEGRSHD